MSEMIDRVASAIQDAIRARGHYTDIARAAIAAMREPTEAMLASVIPSPEALIAERTAEGDDGYRARMDAATTVERLALSGRWRDMIDAALVPPTPAMCP